MTVNHTHQVYDNFYLENMIEDQFNSHLDLSQFCTPDYTLKDKAGTKKKVNVYSATNGTEDLKMGEGNTKNIETRLKSKEYTVLLSQNRFPYYDEEYMTDPIAIKTGLRHMGVDMYNHTNDKVFKEFQKATMIVPAAEFNFDAFVDAQSLIANENDTVETFAFIAPQDKAAVRKALKDSLQYVEAYARTGYVGSVGGTQLYVKRDAVPGEVIVATRQAVTFFVKKGTEIEQERDANVRLTEVYSRKYYMPALTHEECAVKILKGGSFKPTSDSTVTSDKKYYTVYGAGYIEKTPTTENPNTEKLYEYVPAKK